MILYHVTFQKNVPKILYHGLLLDKRKVWANRYGVRLGEKGVIYAWRNWDRAWKWAYKQWYDFGYRPTAIIKFDIEKKYVNIVETLYGEECLVIVKVEPEEIKDVFMFDWTMP